MLYMNRKQRITFSVVGITIVLLTLIGFTYAYYLTRIQGNTNNKSIEITSAYLRLKYDDGNKEITMKNIMPGTIIGTKTFSVTNEGNAKVDGYAVYLEDLINELSRKDDLVYTLTCTTNKKDKSCAGKSETTFPTTNGIIITNSIEVEETQTYELKVTYKEMNIDQSIDMNKNISGKIQIYAMEEIVDLTGTITGTSEGDYVELHSNPKKSEIIDGKYLIPAVEPGNHIIYIKDKDGNTLGQSNLNIVKSSEASFDNDIIKVTPDSQTVTVDIEKTPTKLNLEYKLIEKYNPYSDNKDSLAYKIINNAQNLINNEDLENKRTKWGMEVTAFTSASQEDERVLNTVPDDYGTSYYYRGNVLDNYVSFAGQTWRIVRINGDGSVRLILNGLNTQTKYNANKDDNAYIGYMYGLTGTTTDENRCLMLVENEVVNKISEYTTKEICEKNNGTWTTTAYEATHANIKNSTIKEYNDNWYLTNIEEKGYSSYIADTLFCNNKKLRSYEGISDKTSYYDSMKFKQWVTGTNIFNPSNKCSLGMKQDYSRFTVNVNTISDTVKTNGKLTYPIGLLTADELIFAGAYEAGGANTTYYLQRNNHFWLMSPFRFAKGSSANDGAINSRFSDSGLNNSATTAPHYSRVVINLKKDTTVTGNGTKDNPYTVK